MSLFFAALGNANGGPPGPAHKKFPARHKWGGKMNPFLLEKSKKTYSAVIARWENSGLDPSSYAKQLHENFSRATIRLHLSVLRQAGADKIQAGTATANPWASIKPPRPECSRVDSVLGKSLSPDDTRKLFNYIIGGSAGPRDSALLGSMLFAGLRVSESAGLTWDKVRDSELEILGKGGKVRIIPITPLLNNLLAAIRDKFPARVFGLTVRGCQENVNRHLRALGLKRPGLSAHGLRHSSAQAMLIGGATLNQVRAILGHSSVNTTMVYVETAARHMANPMLNLENLMRGVESNGPIKDKFQLSGP